MSELADRMNALRKEMGWVVEEVDPWEGYTPETRAVYRAEAYTPVATYYTKKLKWLKRFIFYTWIQEQPDFLPTVFFTPVGQRRTNPLGTLAASGQWLTIEGEQVPVIILPDRWSWNKRTALHEIAHLICDQENGPVGHGTVFRECYLRLIRTHLTAKLAREMAFMIEQGDAVERASARHEATKEQP